MPTYKDHWEKVYSERKPDEVSWFQESPALSLDFIARAALPKSAPVIDLGGGASRLADSLLALGYSDLTVLDISANSLAYAKERLGVASEKIRWIEADAASFVPDKTYVLWHDRAVFHFMTDEKDRAGYLAGLRKGLAPGGTLILAAFAEDGPEKCSGLPVRRYGREGIMAELGPGFELQEEASESHRTPWDTEQKFNYFRFLRKA